MWKGTLLGEAVRGGQIWNPFREENGGKVWTPFGAQEDRGAPDAFFGRPSPFKPAGGSRRHVAKPRPPPEIGRAEPAEPEIGRAEPAEPEIGRAEPAEPEIGRAEPAEPERAAAGAPPLPPTLPRQPVRRRGVPLPALPPVLHRAEAFAEDEARPQARAGGPKGLPGSGRLGRSAYHAVETHGNFGLVDTGEVAGGVRRLVAHVPRRARGYQLCFRQGEVVTVNAVRAGRAIGGQLRVLYTTPHHYYAPGRAVTSLVLGVPDEQWTAFL